MTMSETEAQYRIKDEFVVIQMSKELYNRFMEAYNDDATLDFSEFAASEFKVCANFNVVGPAEIQA